MSAQPGYYRHPTLHRDRVVFVCEHDLWSVAVGGGVARRLTASRSAALFPRFSPDGKRIAFTARDDGPTEVYVMDAGGGDARRLTWLGSPLRTVGWSADGRSVLFMSNSGQPFAGAYRLWSVPAAGGPPQLLPFGLAREIAHGPGGQGTVLAINAGDPARWKRYRGGTAGTLWIDRDGGGEFAPLLRLAGNLAGPMWIGRRVFFLSDHEGHGNLYSCTPTGRGLKRHTDHEDFYARYPSSDGRRIVYHAGADLFLHDPRAGETRRLDVSVASARPERARKFVRADEFLEEATLHPAGHSVACIVRGGAFTMPLWEGAPQRHGEVSSARYRLPCWLADGKRFVCVTDESGEEALVLFGGGRRTRIPGKFGRVLGIVAAPAGAPRIALTNHRLEVWIVDLKTRRKRRVDRSVHQQIRGLAWSPDGRWLAYGFPVANDASTIRLCDTRGFRIHEVTHPDFEDYGPSFDPGGKYLYFLSNRVFDPVYDRQYFDLGFPRGSVPCLLPLAKTTPSPFRPALRAPRAPGADAPKRKKDRDAGPVRIDLPGIADRVLAFPVAEGRYRAIRGARGRVFFSSRPIEGSLHASWRNPTGGPRHTLRMYDFEDHRTRTYGDRIGSFSVTADGRTLLLRAGNDLRALAASTDPKDVSDKETAGRDSGWIDLRRLSVAVRPGAEWQQMYREAWRLQRDHFWTPDMSGIDWKRVHDRYRPLVERAAVRAEFSDLLWEMQGELSTSHSYEMGGDYRLEPRWFSGRLGADLEFDRRRKRWRIVRIPRGDSWRRAASSPLAAPGLDVREGDEIVAVDGIAVGARRSPHECLVQRARTAVALTVTTNGRRRRDVVVETLGSEFPLRYRDWVEANRARVHAASKGRVGYVHVPNMGPGGYAEFHRYYKREVDRDGLIVDVRWNGGGHVSQLLLEKLARKRLSYDRSRWMATESYPAHAPAGPLVAITNEHAGSDGDIFCHAWKLLGLGPLVGKRTWGGVVGIWPRHALVDGTITTQAEFNSWFVDVGFGVENYGTDPDIEVEITPADHARGKDPQLDRALKEIRALLKRRPLRPELGDGPDLSPPRLGSV